MRYSTGHANPMKRPPVRLSHTNHAGGKSANVPTEAAPARFQGGLMVVAFGDPTRFPRFSGGIACGATASNDGFRDGFGGSNF